MTLTALLPRDDDSRPGDDAAPPETPQAAREETPAQPETLPAGHAITTAGGERLNMLSQVIAAARHAFRTARRLARDMSGRDGGWVNAGLNGRLPSVSGQRDYLANRRWLPPGHEEGVADRIGEAYYAGIGVPAAFAVNAAGWVFMRLFHFLGVFATLLAGVFLVTWLTAGLPYAAIAVAVLFSVTAGYITLIALLLAARRAVSQRRSR